LVLVDAATGADDKADQQVGNTSDSSGVHADDAVDHVGQVIHYTVTVANDGNVDIDGSTITVTDALSADPLMTAGVAATTITINGEVVTVTFSGDTSDAGILDTSETWTFAYDYAVQQSDLNSNGNGVFEDATGTPILDGENNPIAGCLDNTVTARSTAPGLSD